jgi:hypothetical protein
MLEAWRVEGQRALRNVSSFTVHPRVIEQRSTFASSWFSSSRLMPFGLQMLQRESDKLTLLFGDQFRKVMQQQRGKGLGRGLD